MSIGPRRGIDNSRMRTMMNDEYSRQQVRLNDKSKISQNSNYEIDKRSGFRLVGAFLGANWVITILFISILVFFLFIIVR